MSAKRKTPRHIKHAFIPTAENGRWPHLLHHHATILALLTVVVIELGFLTGGSVLFNGNGALASVLPSVVTWLTNDARAQQKLVPLATSDTLATAAQKKADDMAARSYFSHKDPDGKLPWFWFDRVGYNYKLAGENLAVNFSDSDKLVTAWLNSPAHRANIMKAGYTDIGIGMATGTYQGKQTIFVVQFFGSQRASAGSTVATSQGKLGKANSNVLGVETEQMSLLDWVEASPQTYATYGLIALAVLFLGLLTLAFVPLPKRWPHPSAVLNGLALLTVVLAILILNQNAVSAVRLPADNQNASAARAF